MWGGEVLLDQIDLRGIFEKFFFFLQTLKKLTARKGVRKRKR
jgi:hypothetical protein